MTEFWIALLVFIASHGVIARSPLRQMAVNRIGEKAYLVVYSLLSLGLLAWLIIAAIDAPRIALWPWIHGLYWVPNILMPPAFVLLACGFTASNPLSIAPRRTNFDPERPPLTVAVTRHPVMWGFFLWAFSHLLPNGEFPLALMFGLFALFAIAGTKMIDRKRKRQLGAEEWQRLSHNSTALLLTGGSLWGGRFKITKGDMAGIIIGLVLYAGFFHAHQVLFGIMPTPPMP